MESAEEAPQREQLMDAIIRTKARLDQHEQALLQQQDSMARYRDDLLRHEQRLQLLDQTEAAQQLQPVLQPTPQLAPANPGPLHVETKLTAPQRYDGEPRGCRGFLTQCDLAFELQAITYSSERARIAYVITRLSGRALEWATPVWAKQGPVCATYRAFKTEMLLVFDQTTTGPDAARLLMTIRQDKRSVAEYAIAFRTLAEDSEWNDKALVTAFHHGLSDALKDGLASIGCPTELEPLIAHAVRLDTRIRERRRDQGSSPRPQAASSWSSQSYDVPEPMQLGGARLSAREKDRRMREGRCMYCGETGHRRGSCPELSGKGQVRPARGGL